MKKIVVPLISTIILLLAVLYFNRLIDKSEERTYIETRANIEGSSQIADDAAIDAEDIVVIDEDVNGKNDVELPEKMLMDVPFLVQAPLGNWDEVHEDACEEASLIMLEYYLRGSEITPEEGDEEILRMVEFQVKNYGSFEDTSVKETIEIARDFYGRENLKAVYDFSKDRIKEELAKGNPVILAVAGREIGNPYFNPPGPLYHNIILVGYDGDTIFAHDPGTRRGENYSYSIDVLYGATHDFTGKKDDILEGKKAMIVVR
ncbi:C39 family peptidase [Patescibacteria group bacterium]